jgi:hypothetical protein
METILTPVGYRLAVKAAPGRVEKVRELVIDSLSRTLQAVGRRVLTKHRSQEYLAALRCPRALRAALVVSTGWPGLANVIRTAGATGPGLGPGF